MEKQARIPARGTIGYIVLSYMRDHENVDMEALTKLVHKSHPDSQFKKTHVTWYKHQIKMGKYVYPPIETKKGRKSRAKKQQADTSTSENKSEVVEPTTVVNA